MKYAENLFGSPRDKTPPPREIPPPSPQGAASPQNPLYGPQSTHPPRPAPATPPPIPAPIDNASPKAELAGSKLIVGPNIKLRGVEIDDCDTLVVEGRVEATMVSRAIQIAAGGAFSGKVDVEIAEIHGEFKGELTARRKLVVHASGAVSGKIRYGKMQVNEGGAMSGDVGALEGATVAVLK